MDGILFQVLDACSLARELETSLRTSTDVRYDAYYLLRSCEDIVGAFGKAINGLNFVLLSSYDVQIEPFFAGGPSRMASEIEAVEAGGGSSCVNATAAASGRKLEGSSVQTSSRKRKEGDVVKRVPALPNSESPPDDGYTWKKYGQKEILNCKFPRGYYHCTHKNYYGCNAKKQVQRLDDDPWTFEVTYRGTHTCQSSPTPIIIPTRLVPGATDDSKSDNNGNPQRVPFMLQEAMQLTTSKPTSIQRHNCLAINPCDGEGTSKEEQMQDGRDINFPVVDQADAMFSSWSTSMDAMFSPGQENDQEL